MNDINLSFPLVNNGITNQLVRSFLWVWKS